jgi:hypothetical protein
VFRELEGLVFEMGTFVSGCEVQVNDYIGLIADMRTVVKKRSLSWDMHSPAARTTLYRLLYGSAQQQRRSFCKRRQVRCRRWYAGRTSPRRRPGRRAEGAPS